MLATDLAIIVLGLLGHAVVWVGAVNRVHAVAMPRWAIDLATAACLFALGGVPLLLAVDAWTHGWTAIPNAAFRPWLWFYFAMASAIVLLLAAARIRHARQDGRGMALESNHTSMIDIANTLGHRPVRRGLPALYARLPGNELFQVHVHHKRIVLPSHCTRLNGLRIAHISDLHMSGRITRPYFEEVVRIANSQRADMVVITGDLFDHANCFDWIDSTYAELEAPRGVYFIFGNHDDRVDTRRATSLLEQAGLVHLGGRWELVTAHRMPVVLAGNELPWFGAPPDLANCPKSVNGERPFRVLLSHSPDQFDWAVEHGFDLVLAGHNHGGQVRFPVVGAVLAPSRFGTRYDMGTFQRGQTVMHVSRGTGTHSPVRYNCPPEIAVLELQAMSGAP